MKRLFTLAILMPLATTALAQTPNFGTDDVISNTTLWTFDQFQVGDVIATENGTNYAGLYIKAHNQNNPSKAESSAATSNFGDYTIYTVNNCKAAGGSSTASSFAKGSVLNTRKASDYYADCIAVNIGVPGTLYITASANNKSLVVFQGNIGEDLTDASDITLYTSASNLTTTASVHTISVTKSGTCWITASGAYNIYAIKFVPTNQANVTKKITMSKYGVMTFSDKHAWNFEGTGLNAYYLKSHSNGTLSPQTITNVIPACTGVVLVGTPNQEYTLTLSDVNSLTASSKSALDQNYTLRPVLTDYKPAAYYTTDINTDYKTWNNLLLTNGDDKMLLKPTDGTTAVSTGGAYYRIRKDQQNTYENLFLNLSYTTYTLATNVSPAETGTIVVTNNQTETTGTTFLQNTDLVLTATPVTNYALDYWSTDGTETNKLTAESDGSLKLSITENKSVYAVFKSTSAVTPTSIDGATVNLSTSSFVYNGSAQAPTVSSVVLSDNTLTLGTDYTVNDITSQTNVGNNYTITVTGTGSYEGTASATWSITQATNTLSGTLSIEGWTYGSAANLPSGVRAAFGTVAYKYSDAENGEYGTYEEKVNGTVGTWWVKAFVEGTDNYMAAESSPVSFTISSAATNASYTVEHYQQNIENDEYTKVDGDTQTINTGNAGDQTAAEAKTYEGFTAQSFDQAKIAADGSTVVKIYYTRNSYTISFNSDGGSEVAAIIGKYGSTVTAPDAPTKNGSTFGGWFEEGATDAYVFSTMPAQNLTLTAHWTVNSPVEDPTANSNGLTSNPASFASLNSDAVYMNNNDLFNTTTEKAFITTSNAFSRIMVNGATFSYTTEGAKFELKGNYLGGDKPGATITIPKMKQGQIALLAVTTENKSTQFTCTSGGRLIGTVGESDIVETKSQKTEDAKTIKFIATGDNDLVLTTSQGGFRLFSIEIKESYTVSVSSNDVNMGTAAITTASVIGDGKYEEGTNVEISVTEIEGYRFVNWTEGTTEISTDKTHTISGLSADRVLTANFETTPTTISLTEEMITVGPLTYNGAAQKPTVTVTYNDNTLTENTDYTVTVESKTNAGTYSLTIAGTGNYSGEVTKSWAITPKEISIRYETATVSKSIDDNAFTHPLTNEGDGTITYASSNTNVAEVIANGENAGTVTIKATGTTTITATATNKEDGNYTYATDGNTASYTLTVEAVAETTHDVKLPEGGLSNGQVEFSKNKAAEGDEVTITITPSEGYEVDVVTINGETLSPTEGVYKFNMPSTDVTVNVTFKKKTYTLSATSADDSKGTVAISPNPTDGKYEHGAEVTITATATGNNEFDYWTIDGTKDTQNTTATLTIAMTADKTVVATFKEKVTEPTNEEYVDRATTWTFENFSAVTSITPKDKLYNRSSGNNAWAFEDATSDVPASLTIGGKPVTVTKKATSSGSNSWSANNYKSYTAGYVKSTDATPWFAFNTSVKGTCYALVKNGGSTGSSIRIYFGKADGESSLASDASAQSNSNEIGIQEIKQTSSDKGVFFIGGTNSNKLREIYAIRFAPTRSITIGLMSNGQVRADKSEAGESETITLTVTPATGYKLKTLTANKTAATKVSDTEYTFTMPDADVTIEATFEEIPNNEVTVNLDDNGSKATMTIENNEAKLTGLTLSAAATTITVSGTVNDGTNNIPVKSIADDAFSNITDKSAIKAIDLSSTSVTNIAVNRESGIFKGFGKETIIYLPFGTGNTAESQKNVVIGGTCSDFEMGDGEAYSIPASKSFTATSASFKRTFTADQKCTVCLPYQFTATGGTFYEYTGIVDNQVQMTAKEANTTLSANTPYIFEPSSGATEILATNVTVSMDDAPKTENATYKFNFVGTYESKVWNEAPSGIYGYAAEAVSGATAGQFVRVGSGASIAPFRAYLEYTGATGDEPSTTRTINNLPEVLDIVWIPASGGTTGINGLDHQTADDAPMYNLSGQRVDKNYKGIVIQNGKKMIKK